MCRRLCSSLLLRCLLCIVAQLLFLFQLLVEFFGKAVHLVHLPCN
jgi:hypothetical protein